MNAHAQIAKLTNENNGLRSRNVALIAENTQLRTQHGAPVAPVTPTQQQAILQNDANASGLILLRTMQALKMPTDRPGTTPGTDSLTAKDLPDCAAKLVAELEKLRAK